MRYLRSRLLDTMDHGVLVMDAAMGTRLVAAGLDLNDERDGSALWNLSHSHVVAEIHARDVAVGADVLLTNTFLASRPWLEARGYGNRVEAINRWAASMAREVAGPDRFVVGSIGPTAGESSGAYIEQAESLANAGVDALLFETHRVKQAEFAMRAVRPRVSIPCFVSSHEWSLEECDQLASRAEELGVQAIGVNCANTGYVPIWAVVLRNLTHLPLIVRPSGSIFPETAGPGESPQAFAGVVPALIAAGARLIGGCCGTTEAHVAAIRAACYDSSVLLNDARSPRRA